MSGGAKGFPGRRFCGFLLALLVLSLTGGTPAVPAGVQDRLSSPEDLEATAAGPGQVDLSWRPPDDLDDDDDDEDDEEDEEDKDDEKFSLDHYNVYRDGELVASTGATSYADRDVDPATTYTYRVTAVDGRGVESKPSEPAEVTTPSGPDTTPPAAPSDLRATAVDATSVDLAWSASGDEEGLVDHYRVYRDGAGVGTTTETAFTDAGLEPSTSYTYRVTAVDTAGNESEPSDPAEATTEPRDEPGEAQDTIPPAPPTDLRVVP